MSANLLQGGLTTTTTTGSNWGGPIANTPADQVPWGGVTTTPHFSPGHQPFVPDHRDNEITALRTALHEAYAEIGRLHEQVRGIANFKEWTEKAMREREQQDNMAKMAR